MDRLLRRKLEILRLRHRDPDDERLHHSLDPARECTVNADSRPLFGISIIQPFNG